MVPLGNWVLEEALGRYVPWKQRFGLQSGFFLSVNLDTSQCRQAGLREKLATSCGPATCSPGTSRSRSRNRLSRPQ